MARRLTISEIEQIEEVEYLLDERLSLQRIIDREIMVRTMAIAMGKDDLTEDKRKRLKDEISVLEKASEINKDRAEELARILVGISERRKNRLTATADIIGTVGGIALTAVGLRAMFLVDSGGAMRGHTLGGFVDRLLIGKH